MTMCPDLSQPDLPCRLGCVPLLCLVHSASPPGSLVRRATCKVANLSIRSVVSPCVVHCRGLLTLERCALVCNADGLDHLCAPLVTVAAAGAAGPAGMTAAVRHAVPAGAMAVPRQHLTVAHTAVADATEPVAGPAPSVVSHLWVRGGCSVVLVLVVVSQKAAVLLIMMHAVAHR